MPFLTTERFGRHQPSCRVTQPGCQRLGPLAIMGIGAGVGALGGLFGGGDKTSKQTQNTTNSPWGPSIPYLNQIMGQARDVYGREQAPPPSLNLDDMWNRLNQGGGGGGGGGGYYNFLRGGGGGGGGGGGSGVIKKFNKMAFDTPEQIAQAFGYTGRVMDGIDLNPYYQRYADLEDLNMDSPEFQRIRDSYGRAIKDDMNRFLGVQGNEADLAGMYGSSTNLLERAATRGDFADSYDDALLRAQLGIRDQQMGLFDQIQGAQLQAAGMVPALEQARLMGPQAAADIQNAWRVAQRQAAAQENAARMAAMASMSNTRASLGQQNQQWRYAQALGLTNMGYQDDLNQWGYTQQNPWDELNNYANLIYPAAGMGGTSNTTGSNFTPGNRWSGAIQGGMGGAGFGLGLSGAFGGGRGGARGGSGR